MVYSGNGNGASDFAVNRIYCDGKLFFIRIAFFWLLKPSFKLL